MPTEIKLDQPCDNLELIQGDSVSLKLREIIVPVANLYLDPNNPRLRSDTFEDSHYQELNPLDSRIQSDLLVEMNRPEFAIDQLVDSISSRGFVQVDSIFVREMDEHPGNYLVIEGNRRTTALKRIINRSVHYPASLISEIQQIPVKELIVDDPEELQEQIDFILGIRHHGGIITWGAMQRAHSIYKRYMNICNRIGYPCSIDEFNYNLNIAKEVGAGFNVTTQNVKKSLMVYRVYEQLKLNRFDVKPDKFSLIEACMSKRALANDYFYLDPENLRISEEGMERFDKMVLSPGAPITNPKGTSNLDYIVKNGSFFDIRCLEDGNVDLEDLRYEIQSRGNPTDFHDKLEKILRQLENLKIDEFQDSKPEKELIRRITEITVNKLVSLCGDDTQPRHHETSVFRRNKKTT